MSKDSSMMKILNPHYENRLISRGFLRYIGPALTSLLFAQIAPVVDAFCIAGKLGEIESVLNSYPSVRSCIVLVMKKDSEYLAAYFTADEPVEIEKLKEHLAGRLTEYMVPQVFLQLNEMPLTANGKIDKKALPEINPEVRTLLT